MSERPHEPQSQRPPMNIVRWLLRTFVVAMCGLLLFGAVVVASRYSSNRRLISLLKSINQDVDDSQRVADISFLQWGQPVTNRFADWLEWLMGTDVAFHVMAQPVNLSVMGGEDSISDFSVLQLLQECNGLKTFYIPNRDLPAGCLKVIASQHQIETLHIRLPVITSEDAKWLSRITALRQINVSQFVHGPRENDWSWLKNLTKLESLNVTLWGATDHDVTALAECSASKNLSLSGTLLTDEGVRQLCALPSLELLSLEGKQIRLRLPVGEKFPATLQSLDLDWTSADNESLAPIAELPQLNRVSIRGGSVSDAGMKTLAQLPALRQLWLYELKQVTNEGLKALLTCPSLEEILVEKCGNTSLGLIPLMALPNWKEIRFEDVPIRREPKTILPTLTPETVDQFLSTTRNMQEMKNGLDRIHRQPVE